MARMLCIDFDDTVVLDDVAGQILERFAAKAWKDLRTRRRAGELTLEEYSAAALDLVDADNEEIAAFALSVAKPRDGFLELLDWAHWNDWQAAIVSNGWDIYIDPILDTLGIDRVVRHCGRARRGYRWRLQYLSPRGVQVVDGFKASYVASYKAQGDFVAYIGDGPSDVEPATLSDAVFARAELLEQMQTTHPRVRPFETFHDVRGVLAAESDAWLESFFSTTAAEA